MTDAEPIARQATTYNDCIKCFRRTGVVPSFMRWGHVRIKAFMWNRMKAGEIGPRARK